MHYWSLLWEIPLAALSLLFYRIMGGIFSRLYRWSLSRKSEAELCWRVFGADTLENVPLALPVIMTTGPRWNTHAVIGTIGPFRVSQSLELDLHRIQQSAQSWVAVVYAFPSFETVQSLDSHRFRQAVSEAEPWVTLDLPPGRYTLGVRYYDRAETITYPSVRLDGDRLLQPFLADPQTNDFYDQLKDYPHKGFYLALHYYSYILLKYRHHLSSAWVQREYLPVGAPDTQFFYGGLNRGQTLAVQLEPLALEQFDFYLTLYDWSSFPMGWQRITSPDYRIVAPQNGSYAFRVRPKAPIPPETWPGETIQTSPGSTQITIHFTAAETHMAQTAQ